MYTFTPACIAATTNLLGVANISIKVPGTFNGVTPIYGPNGNVFPNGKWLSKFFIKSDAPSNGDILTSPAVTDTDGVIPGPLQGNFPLYPILVNFYDASYSNSGLYIPSQGIELQAIQDNLGQAIRFVPSQLYITATFTMGIPVLGTAVRINVFWYALS